MQKISLSQKELSTVFEIVDGQLWRKECVGKDGRKYPRKLIKNVANHPDGYCRIMFNGRLTYYHRIVWILLNGDIPAGMQIDHLDGNRINNNISNLRLVDHRENQQNQVRHRNGGLVGCSYYKRTRKWSAKIKVNGKPKHLGYFDTELEAHYAYKNFLQENGLSNG